MLKWNAILANDTYKNSHWEQTPGETTLTYSHLTPRFTKYLKRDFPNMPEKVIAYGMQMTIQIIVERWQEDFFGRPYEDTLKEALKVLGPMLGYTEESLTRYRKLHELGYLPIEFKTLEEGSHVDINIPVMTLQNTHPDFAWLTNYLESTLLQTIFKPLTVATLGLELAKLRDKAWEETVVDMSGKPFALHDFSFRGQSGYHSGSETVTGYLLYTSGTDTSSAVQFAQYYYDTDNSLAGSIPALEHSTATTGIQFYRGVRKAYAEKESMEVFCQEYSVKESTVKTAMECVEKALSKLPLDATEEDKELTAGETFNLVRLLLEVYPTGLFAYVSDSYDYERLISIIVPACKDIILNRNGKLVLRPDSGNPVEVLCGLPVYNVEQDFSNKSVTNVANIISQYASKAVQQGFKYISVNGDIAEIEIKEDGVHLTDVSLVAVKGSLTILEETFGSTVNAKGFKELPSQIGIVYGDGINYTRISQIYTQLKNKGFAASNVVLAAGAYMLAHISRDHLGFAIKASNTVVNDKEIPVYKQPKTDMSKASAKGFFKVVKEVTPAVVELEYVQEPNGGKYSKPVEKVPASVKYVLHSNVSKAEEETGELTTVWKDGSFIKRTTFEEIKQRLPL